MHARNRTWLLGSNPVERCRQRTMNVEGGDGSTLSLDFTTGVLDPRLTLTRTSNATFINSQGYVEWANSNMYWNTAFEGLSGTNPSLTSSGWGYVFSTGNAVFNGDGTMTVTTTVTDRRAIFRSSGFTGNGLRVVAAVDVTIHSGSLTASQVIVTGTPTNAQHYVNGVIWNSSHPIWNGGVLPVGTSFNIAYATDSLTGSTTSIYFGVGCTSAIAGSATFSNPRWTMWKGSGTVPYYPNTSATNNSTADRYKSNDYQGPRFDYDPTSIGTPRGLLIEGSAANLLARSEDMTTVAFPGWGNRQNLTSVTSGFAAPDGNTTAVKIIPNTTVASTHYLGTGTLSVTAQTYTYSCFVKASGYTVVGLVATASQSRASFDLSSLNSAGYGISNTRTITPYPGGWYRISMTWTATVNTPDFWIVVQNTVQDPVTGWQGNATDGILAWGAQLEEGSGASSYIPTGASQGTRVADFCTMPTTSFITGALYPQTLFVDCIPANPSAAFPDIVRLFDRTAGGAFSYGTEIYYYGSSTMAAQRKTIASTSSDRPLASGLSYNSRHKFAVSVDSSAFLGSYDGLTGTGTTTAPPALATQVTHMGVGCTGDTTAGSVMFGTIRQIKFFPFAITQSQLNAITTL